jgi:hypothetical protein
VKKRKKEPTASKTSKGTTTSKNQSKALKNITVEPIDANPRDSGPQFV